MPAPEDIAARLQQAFAYPFGEPVTAVITDAVIVSGCCVGVTYRHVRASPDGRFHDGHRIRTSDIVSAEQNGPFWVLRTLTGSFYVIASLHPDHGWRSLQAFFELRHMVNYQGSQSMH